RRGRGPASPRRCSRRSTPRSRRASTRATSRTRRHCLLRSGRKLRAKGRRANTPSCTLSARAASDGHVDGPTAPSHRSPLTRDQRPVRLVSRGRMRYEPRMSPDDLPAVTFTRMTDATAEDYATILRHSVGFLQGLPDRVLRHLALLGGDTGGYAVDRLTHSLQ